MLKRFIVPDLSDSRIRYACNYLEKCGLIQVSKEENADFVLLGVNPDKKFLKIKLPIFAGNVKQEGVFDYTKSEDFAIKNAYLTAEGAISLAIKESERSIINSRVLITGYGRIAKALYYYLEAFTKRITVAARSTAQLSLAKMNGADTVKYENMNCSEYDYIFNTVPHPVFNEKNLGEIKNDCLLVELASLPGGFDMHTAKIYNINAVQAKGLPARFSPQTAGETVGQTVLNMLKEVKA